MNPNASAVQPAKNHAARAIGARNGLSSFVGRALIGRPRLIPKCVHFLQRGLRG
jgi:hypothetical protein